MKGTKTLRNICYHTPQHFPKNLSPEVGCDVDFAPYQPKSQKAVHGIQTLQFTNFYDDVASNKNMMSPFGMIKNVSVFKVNYDQNAGHSLADFEDQINSLPSGRYKFEGDEIVPY